MNDITNKRYVYVLNGFGGDPSKWCIEGHEGQTVYDADGPYDTYEEAVAAVFSYALDYLDWAEGSFTVSHNEGPF